MFVVKYVVVYYELYMRSAFHIEPNYKKFFHFVDVSRPLESTAEYFGFPLEREQNQRSQFVCRELSAPDGDKVTVYFKLYGYGNFRRALSRFFKSARSKAEKKNLQFFNKLGIPACEPIAQGEVRTAWGLLTNCILVTREVTGSEQLDVFMDELDSSDEDQAVKDKMRHQIIESIATNLRKIHDEHFYHTDLKWRNILVRRVEEQGQKKVEVFWIDCPNGYIDWSRFIRRKHGVIKDIATLDHLAHKRCSDQERLHFLSVYSGFDLNSHELRDLAEKVLLYRKQKGKRRPGY